MTSSPVKRLWKSRPVASAPAEEPAFTASTSSIRRRAELFLAWFRLESSTAPDSGVGLLELLTQALRSCDDESALLELLAATGYRAVDAERYRNARFEVCEERWYRVASGFPRLTTQVLLAAGVQANVLDVEYTIDLSTGTPTSMEADEVACLLDQLVQESV